jgi:hypothetical protein
MKTGQRVIVKHTGKNIEGEVIHITRVSNKELFVIDSLMSEYFDEEKLVK